MKLPKSKTWTTEEVRALPTQQLESLRNNALWRDAKDVLDLCNEELLHRTPKKSETRSTGASARSKRGKTVIGFHFVCAREKGVTLNPDGTFWSGTWVVDAAHAERAPEVGAYLALHDNRKTSSYKQGKIKEWRKVDRDPDYAGRPVKIETGIEFRVQPTTQAYTWVGRGTGEKGYAWSES